MAVITIPSDYDALRHGKSLVPIFLDDTDEYGEKISYRWIEAVIPIQNRLRFLARHVMGDVWRVSELTEATIHHLWRKYRDHVGPHPSHKIFRAAFRKAHGCKDPGARVHTGIDISLDALAEYQRDALVGGKWGTESKYNEDLDLQRLEDRMRQFGTPEEMRIYTLFRAGYSWNEIGPLVGKKPNTAHHRFYKLLSKIRRVV